MRILWHGIGPWHKTGYGHLTSLFTRQLRDLGYEVAIAIMGQRTAEHAGSLEHPDAAETKRTGRWEGMRVIGPGLTEFGMPSRTEVRRAFDGREPDLVLILKDAWVLDPDAYNGYRTVSWLFFDCEPMGVPDRTFFQRAPHVIPVAASRWGQAQARAAGLQNVGYVPSGIDMDNWCPGSREDARRLLGLPQEAFIAGIDAQNVGPRKGFGEQLTAFAQFHVKHPGSLLLMHSMPKHPEGIDLRELAAAKGIEDAVLFGSHTNMTPVQMRNWYRSLNVLMQGSYGEGFGLPVIQAQACGVPVIGTRCSAIPELIPSGCGWTVGGQPWWNPHHQADWFIPNIRELAASLEKAHRRAHLPAEKIREHALRYDAGHVAREHWKPLLDEVMADGGT